MQEFVISSDHMTVFVSSIDNILLLRQRLLRKWVGKSPSSSGGHEVNTIELPIDSDPSMNDLVLRLLQLFEKWYGKIGSSPYPNGDRAIDFPWELLSKDSSIYSCSYRFTDDWWPVFILLC